MNSQYPAGIISNCSKVTLYFDDLLIIEICPTTSYRTYHKEFSLALILRRG